MIVEAEDPQIMPEEAYIDAAEDLPDRADDVPRDQQWQRHQDEANGNADAALGHVEGDENAERDLDRQDDEGEDQVADKRIPEAIGVEEVGEPVGAGPEEGVVSECILHRSEEHTSGLQSLMRISYAVFCLKKQRLHKSILLTTNNSLN